MGSPASYFDLNVLKYVYLKSMWRQNWKVHHCVLKMCAYWRNKTFRNFTGKTTFVTKEMISLLQLYTPWPQIKVRFKKLTIYYEKKETHTHYVNMPMSITKILQNELWESQHSGEVQLLTMPKICQNVSVYWQNKIPGISLGKQYMQQKRWFHSSNYTQHSHKLKCNLKGL
jgi:hypothetical protein